MKINRMQNKTDICAEISSSSDTVKAIFGNVSDGDSAKAFLAIDK